MDENSFLPQDGLIESSSMPRLFDPEVVQRPCVWPCDLPGHGHDQEVPTRAQARMSRHLEVPDGG